MANFKQAKFLGILLAGIGAIGLCMYFLFTSPITQTLLGITVQSSQPYVNNAIKKAQGEKTVTTTTSSGAYTVTASLATTEQQQEQGLMNVTSMPANSGMLFIFSDEPQIRTFWMKNTLIPLDMIFISQNKEVVYTQESAPPCKVDDCPVYSSLYPAEYVLEVNGGWAASHGVQAGNTVSF